MRTKRLPRSIRKFIRQEKARIRREVLSIEEQEKKIKELYEKYKRDANIRMHTNDTST